MGMQVMPVLVLGKEVMLMPVPVLPPRAVPPAPPQPRRTAGLQVPPPGRPRHCTAPGPRSAPGLPQPRGEHPSTPRFLVWPRRASAARESGAASGMLWSHGASSPVRHRSWEQREEEPEGSAQKRVLSSLSSPLSPSSSPFSQVPGEGRVGV